MKKTILALTISSIFVLSGCAAVRVNDSNDAANGIIDDLAKRNEEAVKPAASRPVLRVHHDQPWVQTKAIKIVRPAVVEQYPALNCDLVYVTAKPATLVEFAQRVTSLCGVPIRLTTDALTYVKGGQSMDSSGQMGGAIPPLPSLPGMSSMPNLPLPATAPPVNSGYTSSNVASQFMVNTKFQGQLAGLLDNVTANLGLGWRANATGVEIFYLDSKIYTLMALQATTETSSVVQANVSTSSGSGSGSGSSSTGQGGSNQSTTTLIKNDLIADVEKNLRNMLTPGVGRLSMSPSTGSLAVTDTPQVQARIAEYIARENATMTQQVAFRVEVYAVNFRDDDSASLDLNLVMNKLKKNGFTIKNSSGMAAEASSSLGWTVTGGDFDGSSVLVNALTEQGSVKVVNKSTIYTTNLQPAPIQVSKQTAYLASSTSNNTDSGISTTMEPASITTGFSMTLLPYILPDSNGDILLQYAVNLSNLIRLETVESGDSKIQTPEVDSRIFSQRVKVRDGEMLLVGGFEADVDDATARGTGSAYNPLLGGGFASKKGRSVIVVAITPSMT